MAVNWCVAAAVVALVGCGVEKSRNPLSPSIAGPIEGVVISAPMPAMSDAGLISVTEQPITVHFNAATSNGERPFWYEIEVATSDTFDSLIHVADQVLPSGNAAESYEIPVLNDEQRYVWRVRALDGANTGPYSEVAAFELYTPVTVGPPASGLPGGRHARGRDIGHTHRSQCHGDRAGAECPVRIRVGEGRRPRGGR